MKYEKLPAPCKAFVGHSICILLCVVCWHDYDAHVKANATYWVEA